MVCTKLVFLCFFLRFLCFFYITYTIWYELFLISTLGCFLYGSFGAIRQVTIKRILAYTSITQTGFFFSGILTGNWQGFVSGGFHMFMYIFTLSLFFLLLFSFYNIYSRPEPIFSVDLIGFGRNYPWFSMGFSVVFLSMAGLPPMLGFFTKFMVFLALFNTKHFSLLLLAIIVSVVTAFIYLRFLKIIWFEKSVTNSTCKFSKDVIFSYSDILLLVNI